MSRIFLSHSSRDARQTLALQRWLISQDASLASDIFLDMDATSGIPTGVRWREALQRASDRCEAVICLLSGNWAASGECLLEYETAEKLNKQMFCARLEPSMADNLTSQWQRCDLFGDGPKTSVDVGDGGPPIEFVTDGLQRLFKGVKSAGVAPESFPWPPPDDPRRAPYRGWESLTEADAAVFFGRDAEIVLGLDALRGMRSGGIKSLFVILGPSGAGKSSFLRAGLLPRLRRDDRQFVVLDIVRPGQAAISGPSGLAASIHATRERLGLPGISVEAIAASCLSDPEAVRRLLTECRQVAQERLVDQGKDGRAPTVLLPVDQAEELFSADAGGEAPALLTLFTRLVESGLEIILAATIRTDSYAVMQTARELSTLQTVAFNELRPMPDELFTEVIEKPAARDTQAGRRLAIDPVLTRRLLDDCAAGADRLPILSLTLARLYEDEADSGRLTLAQYEAMGGVHRVVQSEVDALLSTDPLRRQDELRLLREAFIPWLATINPDNDQPMRRVARWTDLPVASRPLIDALVAKRLMVKDTRDGETVVEVALESLLRQWKELAAWLDEQRANLKAADAQQRAADAWEANGRSPEYLWTGTRLTDAQELSATPSFTQRLMPTGEFLCASQQAADAQRESEERQRQAELDNARERQATAEAHAAEVTRRSRTLRRVLMITTVIAVIAVVGVVATMIAFNRANASERLAQNRFHEATATRLRSEARGLLSGTTGSEVRAFQELLAAQAISKSQDDGSLYEALLGALHKNKIIDTPMKQTPISVSADGSRFATLENGTVRVWETATARQIGKQSEGHGEVRCATFSPDGTRIATGGQDNSVVVSDVDTGEIVAHPLKGHEMPVDSVAFSPDGKRIASGGFDNTIRLWDVDSGEPIGEALRGNESDVSALAFSPDGYRLASGSYDYTVRVWDLNTNRQVGTPMRHDEFVTSVTFSSDGSRIVSGSNDFTVRVWDAASGQMIGPPLTGNDHWVQRVAINADATLVASGGFDGSVRIWNIAHGQTAGDSLTGHADLVSALTFSPDGKRLISASNDKTVRVWNAAASTPLATGHLGMQLLGIRSDGKQIATFDDGNDLQWWDVTTGKAESAWGLGIHAIMLNTVMSADGAIVATVPIKPFPSVYTAADGKAVRSFKGVSNVQRVALTRDHTRVALGFGGGAVQVIETTTGHTVGDPLRMNKVPVTALAFSPDGQHLASGYGDKTIQLWDISSGKPIGAPMTGHGTAVGALAFSPDGMTLASGDDDGAMRLWDAQDGHPLTEVRRDHTRGVTQLAFSPDGAHLASSSNDGTVLIWDAKTGHKFGAAFRGSADKDASVNGVVYSPDGEHLYSAGSDTAGDDSLRVWPGSATPKDLCDKIVANMTRKQWNEWVSADIGYVKVCPELPDPPD